MLARAWRGDPRKLSRIHDFAGNLAPPAAYLHLPACIASTLTKKVTGRQPSGPWLGYRAIRRLERLLQPGWHVLEFGAGNSTRWFADRVRRVVSIEAEKDWYVRVRQSLAGRDNVDLVLHHPPYDGLVGELPRAFDFCLIDGLARDQALELALTRVVPGGFVYLDNADVQDAEHARARRLLLAACEAQSVEAFVDFSPGLVTVSQGLLGRLPPVSGGPRR
jgi:hypothetical protein